MCHLARCRTHIGKINLLLRTPRFRCSPERAVPLLPHARQWAIALAGGAISSTENREKFLLRPKRFIVSAAAAGSDQIGFDEEEESVSSAGDVVLIEIRKKEKTFFFFQGEV